MWPDDADVVKCQAGRKLKLYVPSVSHWGCYSTTYSAFQKENTENRLKNELSHGDDTRTAMIKMEETD